MGIPCLQQIAAVTPIDILDIILQISRPRGKDERRYRVQAIAGCEAKLKEELILLGGVIDEQGFEGGPNLGRLSALLLEDAS